MKRVIAQLWREFRFPLVISFVWCLYNLWSSNDWSLKSTINIFGPTFFFASWMFSQWLRVKKQQRVEDDLSSIVTKADTLITNVANGFNNIEDKADTLITTLDAKVNNLINHMTGGDSYCGLEFHGDLNNSPICRVNTYGTYPLHEVEFRITELADFQKQIAAETFSTRAHVGGFLGTLLASTSQIVPHVKGPNVNGVEWVAWNVHFLAMNGHFTQELRWALVNGRWLSATRLHRSDGTIGTELVPDEFPKTDGKVNWDRDN